MIFKGQLQDYRLIKTLGQGVQSIAYQVQGCDDNEIYCIKKTELLNFRKIEEEYINERMENEELKQLLKIYEWYKDDCSVYQVQEFCNGGDLSQLIKKSELQEDEILKIILDIGKQLKCLNSKKFIHQDLKPENIIIQKHTNQDNQYKLCGFGAVVKADPCVENNHCEFQPKIYTPYYQAPETQLQQQDIQLSFSVDIWSFGVVIYEMITRKKLFDYKNNYEILKKMDAYIRDQSEIHEKIDCLKTKKKLKGFLKTMLDPIPEHRPSIEEVIKYFKNYFHEQYNHFADHKNKEKLELNEKCKNLERQLEQQQQLNKFLSEQYKNSLSNKIFSQQLLFSTETDQQDIIKNQTVDAFSRTIIRLNEQQMEAEQKIKNLESELYKKSLELDEIKSQQINVHERRKFSFKENEKHLITQQFENQQHEIEILENQLKHYKKELNEQKEKVKILTEKNTKNQELITSQSFEITQTKEAYHKQVNEMNQEIKIYKKNEQELNKVIEHFKALLQNNENRIKKLQEELDQSKQNNQSTDSFYSITDRQDQVPMILLSQVFQILDQVEPKNKMNVISLKQRLQRISKLQNTNKYHQFFQNLDTQGNECEFCQSYEKIINKLNSKKKAFYRTSNQINNQEFNNILNELEKIQNARQTLVNLIENNKLQLMTVSNSFHSKGIAQSYAYLPQIQK